MSLQPGTTLGPYSVTAKIGEGGMGEVYRARDTKLDRDVALKVLPQAFTDDPDRLARFEREAKVLAALNHPNIGHIYGLEEAEGTRALVLELIEGPTLADRIAQGALPLDEALPIAKQIAEALEAAHEAGVIHRDLKPANIKLRPDGTVKVLDFGLAKAMQPDASDPNMSASPTISLTAAATQMGMVIGTAAYMAPEQAKGKVVDKRADIWAFGAVLYEMLAGKKPFAGDDVSTTLARVIDREPDWDALPTGLSPALAVFLRRCLTKEPKQRVHDIADVRLAIEGAFETPAMAPLPEPTSPRPAAWRLTLPWVAAVLLAAMTGLVVWSLRPSVTSPVSRFVIPAPGLTTEGLSLPVALSPDGRTLVYRAELNGTPQLYRRSMDQTEAMPIRGTENGAGAFFSPDGEWVGFYSGDEGRVKKVSLSGGPPTTLTPAIPGGDYRLASWGPDGAIVFARRGEQAGLWSVADTGGEPRQISAMEGEEGASYYDPRFSPDGSVLAFTIVSGDGERQVAVRSLETGEQRVLLAGTSAWITTTGHLLFTREDSLWAVPFDKSRLAVMGEPSPVLEGIQTNPEEVGRFALGNDGVLAYVANESGGGGLARNTLVWVDRNGQETKLAAEPASYSYPRISPDGTRVAVSRNDQQQDVWVWDFSSETLTPLTLDDGQDLYGEWTLDSQRVVFASSREGVLSLFWKAADFTGGVERLTEAELLQAPQAIAPNGNVVFRQSPTGAGSSDLKMVSLTDDPVIEDLLSTESSELNAAISPNGRWFAYQSDVSGQSEVYVRSFPDADAAGVRPISTSGGERPAWRPDGNELFYVNDNRLWAVGIEMEPAFSRGTPTMIVGDGYLMEAEIGRMYDVDPLTGDRFLMIKPLAEEARESSTLTVVLNWHQELQERVPIP